MGYKINDVPERITKMRAAWAASDAKRDAGLTEPEELEKFRDISYGPYDKWNLLDVYVPKENESGKPFPTILNIHGGGYFYGDKELYRFYCMHLARFGFAVVNINYRLAPEFNFPSPIEDAMAVMHWISKNAAEYNLDKNNVFIVGDSAGAQITSQFACVFTNPEYAEKFGLKAPKDVRLAAIGLACGMYKFPEKGKGEEMDTIMLDYLGSRDVIGDPRTLLHENITDKYPAAYIFTCYNDFLFTECKPYADFLESKGIDVGSKIYGSKEEKEIAHVFHCNLRLEEGERANKAQTDFFKKHMK
ncbi:MAG: alpha/beta hydrolase [Lachnospiraceae bacterium]|nr:alpha/beta hydrolase [Lachnospiraceae bacterium]MBR1650849.1 alpha/beta hydrolase [Lachnospiraceae bacterium]